MGVPTSTSLWTSLAAARADACRSLRFAAGMTVLGGVFVIVQTILFVEEALTGAPTPRLSPPRSGDT